MRGKCDRICVSLLRPWPVATALEDVRAKSVAIHKRAGGFKQRIGLVRMSRRFLGGRDPAVVAPSSSSTAQNTGEASAPI